MKKKKTFLPVLQLTHMLRYIPGLMDKGSPVKRVLMCLEKQEQALKITILTQGGIKINRQQSALFPLFTGWKKDNHQCK
jgi:hypothetical protein